MGQKPSVTLFPSAIVTIDPDSMLTTLHVACADQDRFSASVYKIIQSQTLCESSDLFIIILCVLWSPLTHRFNSPACVLVHLSASKMCPCVLST